MKNKLKFALVYGSTRKKRVGIRFVKYLANQISKNKHVPMIIDPLEYKLPLLDKRFEDFSKNKAPNSVKNIHKNSKIKLEKTKKRILKATKRIKASL